MLPAQRPCVGIESADDGGGIDRIEHAIGNDRCRSQPAGVGRARDGRGPQLCRRVRQGHVARDFRGVATGLRPGGVRLRRRHDDLHIGKRRIGRDLGRNARKDRLAVADRRRLVLIVATAAETQRLATCERERQQGNSKARQQPGGGLDCCHRHIFHSTSPACGAASCPVISASAASTSSIAS